MSNADKKLVTIPFAEHEEAMYRTSRQFKMQWLIMIIILLLLIASNATWLWHTKQFERAETPIDKRINNTK